MDKNEKIFRLIVKENKQRISSICRYYSSNEDDHKDIYQEVLINIWKSLENFRGDAQWGTWVYRVSVNTAIGFAKKEIRRQKLFIRHNDEGLKDLLDYDEGPITEKEIMLQALENKINMLSVVDKIIITLVLESVGHKEIASVIGITEPNVRVKIHRIKNELKNALNLNNSSRKDAETQSFDQK